MIDVAKILELQTTTVDRWHREPIDNPFNGIESTICRQHSFNYQLWHEEDIARSRDEVVMSPMPRSPESSDRSTGSISSETTGSKKSMTKFPSLSNKQQSPFPLTHG